MCSLLRKKKTLSTMPVHLGRALASVKAGAARMQGGSRRRPRSEMPQMVAPEGGGQEAEFRVLLDAVTLSHHQLDRALLEIQRYYEASGVAADRSEP